MSDLKAEYDGLRKKYFKMEDTLKTQLNDEQLAYTSTQKGANMKTSMDTREKLLGNQENLYKQDDQIERIKQTGLNTHSVMVETNRELRG